MKWSKLIILTMVIALLAKPMFAQSKFQFYDEYVNITPFANVAGVKTTIPYSYEYKTINTFGYIYNISQINESLGLAKDAWDYKIHFNMTTDSDYAQSPINLYILEKDLGYTQTVKNEIGQLEERPVKRFFDFSMILDKKSNLYDEIKKTEKINITEPVEVCKGQKCSIEYINSTYYHNYTELVPRKYSIDLKQQFKQVKEEVINCDIENNCNTSVQLVKKPNGWVISFWNLFDLDPVFLDDTDSNWAFGTMKNMTIKGTNGQANITSTNTWGHYASKVFDSGYWGSNWTNFTMSMQFPYFEEIGKGQDPQNAQLDYDGLIDMYGLKVYYGFDNITSIGENGSLIADQSVFKNAERTGIKQINGTLFHSACSVNGTGLIGGSLDFGGCNSYVLMGNNPTLNNMKNMTIAFFMNLKVQQNDVVIVSKTNNFGNNGWRIIFGSSAQPRQYRFLGSGGFERRSTVKAPINTWQCVVATTNDTATGAGARLYFDGVEETTYDATANGGQDDSSSWTNINGQGNTASGGTYSIDMFSIWNRSLTAEEAKSYCARGMMQLNITAKLCNDAVCSAPTETKIFNSSNASFGRKTDNNLEFTSTSRYFQYNLTYSDNQSGYNIVVNNASIDYIEGANNTIEISTCENLNTANTVYALTNSIDVSGGCFNITANKVTLDCHGYQINYSTTGGGTSRGINITANFSTVKSCNMYSVGSVISSAIWISHQSGAALIGTTVTNNTIRVYGGTSANGIQPTTVDNITIINNDIITSNVGMVFAGLVRYAIIEDNKVSPTLGNGITSSTGNFQYSSIKRNNFTGIRGGNGAIGGNFFLLTNVTISDNIFMANGTTSEMAISILRTSKGVLISNNIFNKTRMFGTGTGIKKPAMLISGGGTGRITNFTIINNIFFSNDTNNDALWIEDEVAGNITFINNTFESLRYAINLNGTSSARKRGIGNITFINNTIIPCAPPKPCSTAYSDVLVTANVTEIIFADVSMNYSKIKFVCRSPDCTESKNLTIKNTLYLNVTDSSGVAISSAAVEINDSSNNALFSGSTGADGSIATTQILYFNQNGSVSNYQDGCYNLPFNDNLSCFAPFNISSVKATYNSYSQSLLYLNNSQKLTLVMTSSTIDTTAPSGNLTTITNN